MTQVRPAAYPADLPACGPIASEWALTTLFDRRAPDAWVAAVADPRNGAHWAGGRYRDLSTAFQTAAKAGHYVNTSLIKPGGRHRWDALAESVVFLFFDDVGDMRANSNAKIDRDWLELCGPTPTLIVETSSDNYQYFYGFEEPIEPGLYRCLIKMFKAHPNTGGGFRDGSEVTRYGRLPSGANPKPGRDGFITQLIAGSGRKYRPEDLIAAFGLSGRYEVRQPPAEGPDQCAPEVIERLLIGPDAILRNDARFDSREDYIALLHFVHGATGGSDDGLDIILRWGAEHHQDPIDDPQTRWAGIHSPRGGASALWFLARKFDPHRTAALWFELNGGAIPLPSPSPGADPPVDPDADLWTQFYAALEELRLRTPRPHFITAGSTEDAEDSAHEPDFDYDGPVAIRPAVTDRLTRGMVSMISAAANAGKSTYLSLEALAVALENGMSLGQPSIDWCGNVMVVSNEESRGAILARWRGQIRTSGLEGERLKHKLSVWPTDKTRLRIGKIDKSEVVPTKAGIAFVRALARRAERGLPIAVLGLDTLVSLFEGIEENSATEMDKAIGLLVMIADAGFIAIDVMHHTGKSGPTETAISYRGSSAIFAAVAEMSTLTTLSKEEADALKMSPGQARRTLRMMGQRQRDGIIPGVWHFEREVVSLTAQDPRKPDELTLRTVATLKAVPKPTVCGASATDEAHQTLWNDQQEGRQIRRGGVQGSRHSDNAGSILQELLDGRQ